MAHFVDASDILFCMQEVATRYAVLDYLAVEWQLKLRDAAEREVKGPTQQPVPSSSSRGKICEWIYQVVDHFRIDREVVAVAMSYFDRYLSKRSVNNGILQLLGATALYLAVKLFEHKKLKLPLSAIVHLSGGRFTAEQVVKMEMELLQRLGWYVHPPTPQLFCRDLMSFVGDITPRSSQVMIYDLAPFLTELAVFDYWFVTKKPSSIALASIVNALELLGPHRVDPRYKNEFIETFGVMNDSEVLECYERLREIYLAGGHTFHLDEGDPIEQANLTPAASNEAQEDGSRAVSPDSVIPDSTSRSSQVRVTCPGVNLATELDEDADSNGDMSS